MTTNNPSELRGIGLWLIFLFSLFFVVLLLVATGYGFGYDLFWQQLGAAVAFYISTLVAILAILKKGIRIANFFQFLFLFLAMTFPLIAYYKLDHAPLVVDDFEKGIWGWTSTNALGVNSTIEEQARQSPFGSWHLAWSISNSCEGSSEGWWAIIECFTCPPETFSLGQYKYIEFWYRTETWAGGFNIEIRCPNYTSEYWKTLDPSTKWKRASLILPTNDDVALLQNYTIVGNPNPQEAHIAFANSCNNTYHFDEIRLISPTFLEQNAFLTIWIEALLAVSTAISFVAPHLLARMRIRSLK